MTHKIADQASWARTAERSNMLMLHIMSWISLYLGRRVGRVVLHLIAGYFLLFSPASRRASKAYLALVLDRPVRIRDLYQHFFTFASTIHDRIYLVNRCFDLFDVEVHGLDIINKLIANGDGLFLMGAHLGSFEVIRALGREKTALCVAMVMHQDNAKKINAMLAAINPNATLDIISLGNVDSMLHVRQYLNEGGAVGMLADRTPGKDPLYPVQLLGKEAHLPIGPFRMAALLRRPIVFMTGLYLGGNRYAIHFEELADFSSIATGQRDAAVETAITRYASLIEKYCRIAPYNWFNFFDFWQSDSSKASTKP